MPCIYYKDKSHLSEVFLSANNVSVKYSVVNLSSLSVQWFEKCVALLEKLFAEKVSSRLSLISLWHHILCLLYKVLDPTKRLGCDEMGGYGPLKAHPFFEGVNWDNLAKESPPELHPYLPATGHDSQNLWSQYEVPTTTTLEWTL